MTDREFVLDAMMHFGSNTAKTIQNEADNMIGTELYDNGTFIPDFAEAIKAKNMINRSVGFVCKSSAGRVVRLLQPYDSDIYTDEPEEYSALWGFKWSQNPKDALPFVAMATSPYMIDDVCSENDKVYRSLVDYNVHSPSEYAAGCSEVELD